MRKNFEEKLLDEGFEELVGTTKCISCMRAQDDREIESMLENDEEEETDIYKKEVHPIHLLDHLKELYERHGVKWRSNKHGNVYAFGETCLGTAYVFYVNWEKCSTVKYYESEKSYCHYFGEWSWDMVPIDEMISYQNRNRMERKRKHSENEDEKNNEKKISG